jgi:polyferredoxin
MQRKHAKKNDVEHLSPTATFGFMFLYIGLLIIALGLLMSLISVFANVAFLVFYGGVAVAVIGGALLILSIVVE